VGVSAVAATPDRKQSPAKRPKEDESGISPSVDAPGGKKNLPKEKTSTT
jgi:hypothetical protein